MKRGKFSKINLLQCKVKSRWNKKVNRMMVLPYTLLLLSLLAGCKNNTNSQDYSGNQTTIEDTQKKEEKDSLADLQQPESIQPENMQLDDQD